MGGKSRKSGGVSRKLIAKLQQQYSANGTSKSSCGKKKCNETKTSDRGLFDAGGKE